MRSSLVVTLIALVACGSPPAPTPPAEPTVKVDGQEYRVSGPYTHENLSVYFIRSPKPDRRDFITLDEGLKNGSVKVTEKDHAQVNELQIENTGDTPLFLQEGDRLQGGKQDRMIATSLVVPGKSGTMPVPSFCIEQGRWEQNALTGAVFDSTDSTSLASKDIREAAKIAKDQGGVWQKVAEAKQSAEAQFAAPNATSSFNETMDSPQVRKACEAHEKALAGAIGKHADAVGVAFAVNGKIEEVNLYPSTALLAKLYPRLVKSYALAAALDKKQARSIAPAEVAAFMKSGGEKSKKEEQVNGDNGLNLVDYLEKVACDTRYKGQSVHKQWMRK